MRPRGKRGRNCVLDYELDGSEADEDEQPPPKQPLVLQPDSRTPSPPPLQLAHGTPPSDRDDHSPGYAQYEGAPSPLPLVLVGGGGVGSAGAGSGDDGGPAAEDVGHGVGGDMGSAGAGSGDDGEPAAEAGVNRGDGDSDSDSVVSEGYVFDPEPEDAEDMHEGPIQVLPKTMAEHMAEVNAVRDAHRFRSEYQLENEC
jgi:hypothetical protein